ncbi:hypothetical protein EG329_011009 [Mollisiaceae sp. DMI_Dod_QoI]|nr:hypothetical protein EG329_011009 [Helotiales sp. DMI_Dod_QoI]
MESRQSSPKDESRCTSLRINLFSHRISMPQLASSHPGPHSTGGGVDITTKGNPLTFSLPKLWNTTQISLSGTIESFSFPSLITIDNHGGFTLNSSFALNFTLAPLESLGFLNLQGNITGFGLSTIEQLLQIRIFSSVPVNCTPAAETWARVNNIPLITDPHQQDSNVLWKGFHCEYFQQSGDSSLSKAAKLGIGLGIGLPALLVFGYLFYRASRRNASRWAKPPPPYDHDYELDDRHGHGVGNVEPLPTYAPRATETAVTISEVSSLSDIDEEHPRHENVPTTTDERPDDGVHAGVSPIETVHNGFHDHVS